MTKITLFPGQGSQKVGMGAGLFAKFPREVAQADDILGWSVERLCLEDPDKLLDRTDFTQPALFVVNALTYLDGQKGGAPRPDFVAGHSLGEYDALFASGAFDFPTGLRLVKKRGELMGRARGGGMAAVIGLPEAKVREVLTDPRFAGIDLANLNSPKQAVVSGPVDEVSASREAFEAAGAQLFVPLKVSAAFHSRAMADSAAEFRRFASPVEFRPLAIPVVSNVTARPYGPGETLDLLARQISSPVRWSESIQYLLGQPDPEFVEAGPGAVLAGLLRQIRAAARA